MGFMELPTKRQRGVGPVPAKIMIIGDSPDNSSFKDGLAFSGPSLTVLENCLHQARLTKAEVYMTCLRDDKPHVNDLWNRKAKPKRTMGDIDIYWQELQAEIEKVNPKVIAASGELTTFLLTGKRSLTSVRGYPFDWKDRIVVPVLEPHNMIWSNYIWRYYLSHDFNKIARYCNSGYREPEWKTIHNLSFGELCAYLDYINTIPRTSYDIEVSNFEVSCIGFSINSDTAVVVPFDSRWTEEEEVILWRKVATILENREVAKVGQNNCFDIYFLAYRMGIFVKGFKEDTMMAHSIMWPDFLKSLNFLASIYTDLRHWKDMVNFKNIKKEA